MKETFIDMLRSQQFVLDSFKQCCGLNKLIVVNAKSEIIKQCVLIGAMSKESELKAKEIIKKYCKSNGALVDLKL